MIYEFKMYKAQVEDHIFWVAESKILNGCSAQGDTAQQAYAALETAEQDWLETAKELGWKIPEVPIRDLKVYSGKVALRISPMVHKAAAEYAEEQGISLNQYIGDAILAYNERAKYENLSQIVPANPIAQTGSLSLSANINYQPINIIISNLKGVSTNV